MRLYPNVHRRLDRPCYLPPDLGFLPESALFRIPGGPASSCVCLHAAKPVSVQTHTHTQDVTFQSQNSGKQHV